MPSPKNAGPVMTGANARPRRSRVAYWIWDNTGIIFIEQREVSMKKLVLGLALILIYAAPVLACDCDTASAVQQGYQDRLHRAFLNDPQSSGEKAKKPEAKAPKQETTPQQGGLKEESK
jgi:hypothetical protein